MKQQVKFTKLNCTLTKYNELCNSEAALGENVQDSFILSKIYDENNNSYIRAFNYCDELGYIVDLYENASPKIAEATNKLTEIFNTIQSFAEGVEIPDFSDIANMEEISEVYATKEELRNCTKGEKGDKGDTGVFVNLATGESEIPIFTIVDDVETDSPIDALSARQGKKLFEAISYIASQLNISLPYDNNDPINDDQNDQTVFYTLTIPDAIINNTNYEINIEDNKGNSISDFNNIKEGTTINISIIFNDITTGYIAQTITYSINNNTYTGNFVNNQYVFENLNSDIIISNITLTQTDLDSEPSQQQTIQGVEYTLKLYSNPNNTQGDNDYIQSNIESWCNWGLNLNTQYQFDQESVRRILANAGNIKYYCSLDSPLEVDVKFSADFYSIFADEYASYSHLEYDTHDHNPDDYWMTFFAYVDNDNEMSIDYPELTNITTDDLLPETIIDNNSNDDSSYYIPSDDSSDISPTDTEIYSITYPAIISNCRLEVAVGDGNSYTPTTSGTNKVINNIPENTSITINANPNSGYVLSALMITGIRESHPNNYASSIPITFDIKNNIVISEVICEQSTTPSGGGTGGNNSETTSGGTGETTGGTTEITFNNYSLPFCDVSTDNNILGSNSNSSIDFTITATNDFSLSSLIISGGSNINQGVGDNSIKNLNIEITKESERNKTGNTLLSVNLNENTPEEFTTNPYNAKGQLSSLIHILENDIIHVKISKTNQYNCSYNKINLYLKININSLNNPILLPFNINNTGTFNYQQVIAPVIDPPTGTYSIKVENITATCGTSDANIYYYFNRLPIEGFNNLATTQPRTQTSSITIFMFATKTGMIDSPYTWADYTITPRTASGGNEFNNDPTPADWDSSDIESEQGTVIKP